ncbi:MAG TPA: TIGR03087 family PEP-CTERM/XrtA system glycosyltransferase [Sphingomonas sp.]
MSLLFLAHRAPFAPDRGDRIRSYHVLRHLAVRMPVHLVTFANRAGETPPSGLASCTVVPLIKPHWRAAAQALATGQPVSLTAFADPAFRAAVAAVMARHRPDSAYVFSGQMAQHVPHGLPFVMDFVDVDSAKFAALGGPLAWLYAREARLLAAEERRIAARAGASLFVSAAEAALFGEHGRVMTVENGVDTTFFDPAAALPVAGGAEIVFTGQMDYAPNVEAAGWFARDILPLVRQRHPDVRFAIVGRAPTAAVRALAALPGVEVTGAVADVRGHLAAASVAVAPLRLARGIQNKVLEAMAMARPVVTTRAAAEGIDHAGTLRIADTDEAFARTVADLFGARAERQAIGKAARAQVIRRYGWAAALAPLHALYPPCQAAA